VRDVTCRDSSFDIFCLASVLHYCTRLRRLHVSGYFPDAKLVQRGSSPQQQQGQQGDMQVERQGEEDTNKQQQQQGGSLQREHQQVGQARAAMQVEGQQPSSRGVQGATSGGSATIITPSLGPLEAHTSLTELDLSCQVGAVVVECCV
jgi:hypothetical protein